MARSSKKRKEKRADFTKPKLKVGKGKQPANNAISTTFKARSIVVPEQSIVVEKSSSEPTTRRKLTVDDLIGHLRHHNANVRKDALLGLRELLGSYPEIIDVNLTHVLRASTRLITDDDPSVRKGLLSFFSWLLPFVNAELLRPHASLLLLFTTSAQSHIFPEVRIDAVRCLDILLEAIPDIVVNGWSGIPDSHGNRVLEGYMSLLNAGSRFNNSSDPTSSSSAPSVTLSSNSRSLILNSLATFLDHATGSASHSESSTYWYLESSFTSAEAYERFTSFLRPTTLQPKHRVTWVANGRAAEDDYWGAFDWTFQENVKNDSRKLSKASAVSQYSNLGSEMNSEEYDSAQVIMRLCSALNPVLISVFLDCAPTALSPALSPSETDLRSIVSVVRIARALYTKCLNNELNQSHNTVSDGLQQLLNHMLPYFPFGESAIPSSSIKIDLQYHDLNSVFCELASLLVIAFSRQQKSRPQGQLPHNLSIQLKAVEGYIVRSLNGETRTDSISSNQSLSPTMYSALMPSFWSLIMMENNDEGQVMKAILGHAKRVSSTSVIKKLSVTFLSSLLLAQYDIGYRGVKVGIHGEQKQLLTDWLLHLPKVLWELGDSDPSTTETVLLLVLRLLQRRSSFTNRETQQALCDRFVPFFCIHHKVKGELLGPFVKFKPKQSIRRLVLDVLSTLLADYSGHEELLASIRKAVLATGDLDYWTALESWHTHVT